jgi:hypothetical protein
MKTVKIISALVLVLGVLLFLGTCATTETQLHHVSGETWDYVIIGSSNGTLWTPYYQDMVEADLGVKLISHTWFQKTVSELLNNIRNDERMREDIQKAEIITIGLGYGDMSYAVTAYGAGVPKTYQRKLSEALHIFRDTYDALFTELLTLTSPTRTIIRTMDFYYPFVGSDQKDGVYDQNRRVWSKFNACIIKSARRHDIPVARVFAAFHGPKGNEDPVEKGFLSLDGYHPSEGGKQVVAEEFRNLGYGYASP